MIGEAGESQRRNVYSGTTLVFFPALLSTVLFPRNRTSACNFGWSTLGWAELGDCELGTRMG